MIAAAILALLVPMQEGDVTVTARRLPVKPIRNPIGYFERHCVDATRMTGRPTEPRADRDWRPLTAQERAGSAQVKPGDRAWTLVDAGPPTLLLILAAPVTTRGLLEQTCTLIVSGGDQQGFAGELERVFRSSPTTAHVDHERGEPRLPGWRQQRWNAIPRIGSTRWDGYQDERGRGGFVYVTHPGFYTSADYVVANLRTRIDGAPRAIVALTYVRRPRDRE